MFEALNIFEELVFLVNY